MWEYLKKRSLKKNFAQVVNRWNIDTYFHHLIILPTNTCVNEISLCLWHKICMHSHRDMYCTYLLRIHMLDARHNPQILANCWGGH